MTHEQFVRSGIIEPEELRQLFMENPHGFKIIDATYAMPNSGLLPHATFAAKRIPGAVFFDIDKIADPYSNLPHMLPDPSKFEVDVSNLGISNHDMVVIYGQNGMIMGPARAWWMFKTFGHDHVCVLNGGLPAWLKAGFEIENTPPALSPKSSFTASFRPDWVASQEQVEHALNSAALILDARPEGRFRGNVEEPRPGLYAGHIPGSQNLPSTDLIVAETGKLKDPTALERIFANLGVSAGLPVIATCGSGVTACMIALAVYHLNRTTVRVYDGSWAEWGQKNLTLPVKTK